MSIAAALLIAMTPLASTLAQTPPDAGVLRQQIEKELQPKLPGVRKPLVELPPEYKPAPGLAITVKSFRFAGNTLLSDAQLETAVKPFLNRLLDFNGLQQATAAVGEAYREAGWLVRVYLPRQEIRDGIVILQIVEGIFGTLRVEDPAPLRLSSELAKSYIDAAQSPGKPLNAAALDRAMQLIGDLPGVAVSGSLAPGKLQAETDLILKLTDEDLFSGEMGLDQVGARATGAERLTANLYLNSPLKFGDLVTANLIHSEGSDYARLAYSIPVGYDGWRLGANASALDYRIVAKEFAALHLKGWSANWGLDAQYPLIRARTRNLYLSAAYEDKAYNNESSSATTSAYSIRNLNLGLTGNLFDTFGGGGANMASLTLTSGEVALGRLNSSENAALDGRFTKLSYALSRQQALTPDLSLFARLSGQLADRNLDSSEKFYLGGASGVRAYPVSEAGGAEGTMLNFELRYRLQPKLLLAGFYDWGQVVQNRDNNIPSPASPNRYDLQGMGVSIAWTGPWGMTIKGTYARRIGDNPNRNAQTGKDQDGSLDLDRFWLSATLPF